MSRLGRLPAARSISLTLLWNISVLLSTLPANSQIVVAAASDLSPLQPLLAKQFAAKTPIRFTFGSSGMLARQIANGAPFDLFLSADETRVRELAAAGQILPDSVRTYGVGRLGLWSRSGTYRSIAQLDSRSLAHLAIAHPDHAPYGQAAKQALQAAGLWEKLRSRVVFGENVRQAFQFAESGNADATLTAWALVRERGGIQLPAALHQPVRQTGGVVAASKQAEAARQVLEFLTSPAGRRMLASIGLDPVR